MIHLGSLPASLVFPHDSARRDPEKVFLWYDAHQLRNIGESIVLLIGSGFFSGFFQLPFHEFGHGTRFAAVGLKPYYAFGPGFAGVKRYTTFFAFYAANLFRFGSAFTHSIEPLYLPRSDEWLRDWSAVISMGGMNNAMFFAELIEDEILRFGGHIGFGPTYVYGKLSAALYRFNATTGNDKEAILSYYAKRGFPIHEASLKRASYLSLLLSSLTYQTAFQLVQMLRGEAPHFQPWHYEGVQLPNTEFYMTRAGLSYKFRTAYRLHAWRFPIAVEHVFNGEKQAEATLGAETLVGLCSVRGAVVIGKALEFETEVRYLPSQWFALAMGYSLYNVHNLHGERMIPSLKAGAVAHSVYVRAALVY